MPTNTSTTSEQAGDPSSDLSVLDFLYHDNRRIGSFLAQFEGDGLLQQLTRTKNGSRGKNETSKREGKADFGVASGKLEGVVENTLLSAEGYARVFDPYWSNARAFLNYLSEADMLNRNFRSAAIGQFVLVKGSLSVLDLAMLKDAWKLPSIQKKVAGGDGKSPSLMTAAEKAALKLHKENSGLMLDMMQVMPHSVQAHLFTDQDGETSLIWGALREEYMTQPVSEIALTHGVRMPGTWSIVGILAATPEFTAPDISGTVDDENVGTLNSMVGTISSALAPIVRFTLGRPAYAHAVTPLLIFREVA